MVSTRTYDVLSVGHFVKLRCCLYGKYFKISMVSSLRYIDKRKQTRDLLRNYPSSQQLLDLLVSGELQVNLQYELTKRSTHK